MPIDFHHQLLYPLNVESASRVNNASFSIIMSQYSLCARDRKFVTACIFSIPLYKNPLPFYTILYPLFCPFVLVDFLAHPKVFCPTKTRQLFHLTLFKCARIGQSLYFAHSKSPNQYYNRILKKI